MLLTWIEVKCGDSSRMREKDKTAYRRGAAVMAYRSPSGGLQDVRSRRSWDRGVAFLAFVPL